MQAGKFVLIAVAALFASSATSFAQSEADFVRAFAGDWQTLDQNFGKDGACRLQLQPQSVKGGFGLKAEHCAGALSDLDHWAIVDKQLALVRGSGDVVARLGGNQQRIDGQTPTGPVVFERVVQAGNKTAASTSGKASCIYYGYTASCADAKDLDLPKPVAGQKEAQAGILVALNARAQANNDADIVATIPAGTCVQVDQCKTESGVNWCRAQVANFSGWIKQQATRMNHWPILTFTGQCSAKK